MTEQSREEQVRGRENNCSSAVSHHDGGRLVRLGGPSSGRGDPLSGWAASTAATTKKNHIIQEWQYWPENRLATSSRMPESQANRVLSEIGLRCQRHPKTDPQAALLSRALVANSS